MFGIQNRKDTKFKVLAGKRSAYEILSCRRKRQISSVFSFKRIYRELFYRLFKTGPLILENEKVKIKKKEVGMGNCTQI